MSSFGLCLFERRFKFLSHFRRDIFVVEVVISHRMRGAKTLAAYFNRELLGWSQCILWRHKLFPWVTLDYHFTTQRSETALKDLRFARLIIHYWSLFLWVPLFSNSRLQRYSVKILLCCDSYDSRQIALIEHFVSDVWDHFFLLNSFLFIRVHHITNFQTTWTLHLLRLLFFHEILLVKLLPL